MCCSGKLQALKSLLTDVKRTTADDRFVLISNATQTLDIFAAVLTSLRLTYIRLDGSTPAAKRQEVTITLTLTLNPQPMARGTICFYDDVA